MHIHRKTHSKHLLHPLFIPELLTKIFLILKTNLQDLVHCSLVCQQWKACFFDNIVWKEINADFGIPHEPDRDYYYEAKLFSLLFDDGNFSGFCFEVETLGIELAKPYSVKVRGNCVGYIADSENSENTTFVLRDLLKNQELKRLDSLFRITLMDFCSEYILWITKEEDHFFLNISRENTSDHIPLDCNPSTVVCNERAIAFLKSDRNEKEIFIIDPKTGNFKEKPLTHHTCFTSTLYLDGCRLLGKDVDGIIHIWDIEKMQHIRSFKNQAGFSPALFQNGLFVSANRDKIALKDLNSEKETEVIQAIGRVGGVSLQKNILAMRIFSDSPATGTKQIVLLNVHTNEHSAPFPFVGCEAEQLQDKLKWYGTRLFVFNHKTMQVWSFAKQMFSTNI